MNILIIGSGGREHALGWKIKQSPLCDKIVFTPGNAGTAELGTNVPVGVNDFAGIKKVVLENNIKLVITGPEEPLVNGITDFFRQDNDLKEIGIIGPSKIGAQLEGSKDYAKQFMLRHNIPTARYLAVNDKIREEGKLFMKELKPPYVLKADGLAAGKGVLIIDDYDEACSELDRMLGGKFGAAGKTVVIEEFLSGIELSVFVLTDGKDYFILPEAKDYKRIGENDSGLNTGGMGAVSPVSFANADFMKKIEDRIVRPTVNGINKEGIDYKGFIFFGLIKVNDEPYVIEYNVRMGDPETEAVLPRLKNDLVELLQATLNGTLNEHKTQMDPRFAVTVVLVSGGYPGDYKKGIKVSGLDQVDGSLVYHAGTALEQKDVLTNGGRVFAVTSLAPGMNEARKTSLKNADKIIFEGKYFRKDIGFDL
ncbi:phosphoribosylamine--glycine ligase [Alkalitalea saponilacus]|uniref:Phosphoribosylamine--glycine ligase n=1 Tax=Alkalitalea saponilacus TaxID=889453 RepID=A0A1T5HSN4_9BACT|nr:phosphoribosylamine--glycine ligase [Alkalitalea saponilacus]ASB49220.1 phosphoribosylamine--glycine ligase [Alkalitalea saponilacus]SKC23703.1 phosphoribosylamine--glycine ligase [Alkalitalea saponilacus]